MCRILFYFTCRFLSGLTSFTFLSILITTNVLAQQRHLKFEYLTPNDGLSQVSVSRIIEDKHGFMWFGTRNGLNRYDGYSFKKYYNDPKNPSSISGDLIECLYLDRDSNLWVGTNNGLSLYDEQNDNFFNFNRIKNFPQSLLGLSITCIFQDSKGFFWIGTYGGGLAKWDRKTDTYILYQHDPENSNSICSNSIFAILEDENYTLWLASPQNGLDKFSPSTNTFVHFTHDPKNPQSISSNLIWAIGKDNTGKIWIATLGGGLNSAEKTSSGKYIFTCFKPETSDIRRFKILSMLVENDKGVWLGTENAGLDFFDFKTKKFTNYTYNEKQLNGLNNSSIQSIYLDRVGNLWIGTYTGGINVDKKFKKNFETYKNIVGNDNSLSFNAVSCLYYNQTHKTLWVGTDGGGLNIIDTKTNTYSHYNRTNSNLLSDAVLAICEDSEKRIWVGGLECGLNLYHPATKSFINIPKEQFNFPNNNIFDLAADNKGQIWITFTGQGFGVLNFEKKTLKTYNTKNSKLPNDWVFEIDIDWQGNILLGHTDGFSIFNPKNETIENFQHSETDTTSLSHNQVNTITVGRDSTIWIGTSNGLNLFTYKSRKFTHYTKNDGLPNNSISAIVEDKNHNIWVSTNDGISKFNRTNKTFKNYSLADGLQGKGFSRSSCLLTDDGRIYFGGPNGFNVFHPDSLADNPTKPNIVITGFSIFNTPVVAGEKGSPLKKNIVDCDTLILSYKQSVISFEFAALDFTLPEQNKYKYKLEGFDKDWNNIGSKRVANYTNLDPGTYILRIKTSNNDNVWSDKEKTLTIIVTPPFWQTWWFRSLLIIFIISMILLYIRIRTNILKKRNIILEQKVKERTFELEEINTILEEKQEEINTQTEELTAQRDSLEDVNELLIERNNKIEEQNSELDKHRNELEKLVEQRTSQLEQALLRSEEADRLKSSFLANMSHEIRTPMNAIIGFTNMLSDEGLTDEEKNEFIDIITKNGESLLYLIDDILDLSKIQANQLTLQKSQIVLGKFLGDLQKNLVFEAEKKGVPLLLNRQNIPSDLALETDSFRLKQVFSNLITNSLKFTAKGFVEFGISSLNKNITFYVKDTGIGIPKDIGNTIFHRFTKIEDKKNKLYSGTGLGLSISKSLVELWGGQIWYESEENVETTFFFTHPLQKTEQKAVTEPISNYNRSKLPNLTGKTVLIAEDEEYNYKLLLTYLSKSNANIVWVTNGKEVMDYIDKNTPDVILMDIKMPLVNGIEAAIYVKKRKPEIPIIAQTAFAFENEIKDFQKAGMNEYLVKPIKLNELNIALRNYFGE